MQGSIVQFENSSAAMAPGMPRAYSSSRFRLNGMPQAYEYVYAAKVQGQMIRIPLAGDEQYNVL